MQYTQYKVVSLQEFPNITWENIQQFERSYIPTSTKERLPLQTDFQHKLKLARVLALEGIRQKAQSVFQKQMTVSPATLQVATDQIQAWFDEVTTATHLTLQTLTHEIADLTSIQKAAAKESEIDIHQLTASKESLKATYHQQSSVIRQLEADLEFPHKEKYEKKVTEVMIQGILKEFEKIKARCAASKPDEFVDVADGDKACEVTDLSETLKSLLTVLDSTILRLRQAKISKDELAATTQELKEAGVTKLSCSKKLNSEALTPTDQGQILGELIKLLQTVYSQCINKTRVGELDLEIASLTNQLKIQQEALRETTEKLRQTKEQLEAATKKRQDQEVRFKEEVSKRDAQKLKVAREYEAVKTQYQILRAYVTNVSIQVWFSPQSEQIARFNDAILIPNQWSADRDLEMPKLFEGTIREAGLHSLVDPRFFLIKSQEITEDEARNLDVLKAALASEEGAISPLIIHLGDTVASDHGSNTVWMLSNSGDSKEPLVWNLERNRRGPSLQDQIIVLFCPSAENLQKFLHTHYRTKEVVILYAKDRSISIQEVLSNRSMKATDIHETETMLCVKTEKIKDGEFIRAAVQKGKSYVKFTIAAFVVLGMLLAILIEIEKRCPHTKEV